CNLGLVCKGGKCAAPTPKGGVCDPMEAACDVGLNCSPMGTCVEYKTAEVGQKCGFVDPDMIYCVRSHCSTTTNTCMPPLADRTPCDPNDDACGLDSFCMNAKCTAWDPSQCK